MLLSHLPYELLLEILEIYFNSSSCGDVLNLSSTCRNFRTVFFEDRAKIARKVIPKNVLQLLAEANIPPERYNLKDKRDEVLTDRLAEICFMTFTPSRQRSWNPASFRDSLCQLKLWDNAVTAEIAGSE